MSRLREVRRALVEVRRLEQSAALANRGGENRRVDAKEATLIEEIVDRLLDFVSHDENRPLLRAPQPQVPVVEQEVDAVLLRLNRIIDRARAHDREIGDRYVESARRSRLCPDFARHADGRLQRQLLKPGPHFRRDLRLDDDRLCDTAAVAQHGERDLAGGSQVSNPRVNRHRLADVSAQFGESGV